MEDKVVQVYHDAFGRYYLMRSREPHETCAWCGGQCGYGGAFRYGIQGEASPRTSWQNEAFCSIGCMRTYFGMPTMR
jgi:hypothetical protein